MLRIDEVYAGYNRVAVLRGASLEVKRGEIVAVLGRNGVGKSTLLRAVTGLIQTTSGSILLNGNDVTQLPAHKRARLGIAYVPQERDIFPRLTVRENLLVAVHAAGRGDAHQRVADIFSSFPILADKLAASGSSLSGGMQQLLAVGRALISEPRILLLDEPSEGIQPSIVDTIVETLRRINLDLGIAIVLVSQNLDLVADLADEVNVMDQGRVVRRLPTSELLGNTQLQQDLLGV